MSLSADLAAFPALCKTIATYFPLRDVNFNEAYDNKKFYVRPLECKLKDTIFKKMENWGPESFFDTYCVDFDKGDPMP